MPEDNQQWPSEDEDFDATTDSKSSPVVVSDKPSKKEAKSVKVTTDNQEDEVPEQTNQDEHQAPAEDNHEGQDSHEHEQQPEQPAPEAHQAAFEPAQPAAAKKMRGPKMKMPRKRTLFEAVLLVAVIGLGLWAWNLHTDNQNLQQQVTQLNNNPQVAVQRQTEALLRSVGKLIQLPTGETPTIANVTDANAAKKQSAFFNNAQNGDKVLMYAKAGQAILYRPSTGHIVLVAPLTFSNNTTTTTPTTKTTTTTPTTTTKTTH